jgi:hypothetical protein
MTIKTTIAASALMLLPLASYATDNFMRVEIAEEVWAFANKNGYTKKNASLYFDDNNMRWHRYLDITCSIDSASQKSQEYQAFHLESIYYEFNDPRSNFNQSRSDGDAWFFVNLDTMEVFESKALEIDKSRSTKELVNGNVVYRCEELNK